MFSFPISFFAWGNGKKISLGEKLDLPSFYNKEYVSLLTGRIFYNKNNALWQKIILINFV